jgi:hypothetical protein
MPGWHQAWCQAPSDAGCCAPLLDLGPSRRYLRNPCAGAWTLTPPHFAGACTRFLPGEHRPSPQLNRFGVREYPTTRLLRGGLFRGCSHSLMFRLPHLLGPLTAPTAASHCSPGGWAVYTTQ